MASLRQDSSNSLPRSSQTAQTDAAAGVRYSRLHPQHGSDDAVSGHSENNEEPRAQEGDAVHATNDHPQAHASSDRQNIEKLHSMHKAYDRLASDYWTYELMGILVCLATLVSIFAVLFVYHNGPTPHFVRGISVSHTSKLGRLASTDCVSAQHCHIDTCNRIKGCGSIRGRISHCATKMASV